jgi:hypothetical protein
MSTTHDNKAGSPRPASTISDLTQLEGIISIRGMLIGSSVELDLNGLDPDESVHWESAINQRLSACGCKEGAMSMVAFVAAYVAYLLISDSRVALSGWQEAAVGFGIACGGAVFGKLIGLLRARWLLRRSVHELRSLTARSPDCEGRP